MVSDISAHGSAPAVFITKQIEYVYENNIQSKVQDLIFDQTFLVQGSLTPVLLDSDGNALGNQVIYSQFFDFISLNKNKKTPVPLTEQGKKLLNEAFAHEQLWNYGLSGLISWLESVNEEGIGLVTFIQKEYHLK